MEGLLPIIEGKCSFHSPIGEAFPHYCDRKSNGATQDREVSLFSPIRKGNLISGHFDSGDQFGAS
jgi:hypothetical protein